jgi:hypothetical protein
MQDLVEAARETPASPTTTSGSVTTWVARYSGLGRASVYGVSVACYFGDGLEAAPRITHMGDHWSVTCTEGRRYDPSITTKHR